MRVGSPSALNQPAHVAASSRVTVGERVHPGAVAAARRSGLDLAGAHPTQLTSVKRRPVVTITVCDRAHEELEPDLTWLHWSIPDPVPTGTRAAFDTTVVELRRRITDLVGAA